MKLLIEEYQYDAKDVAEVLEGLFTLQDIDNKISVCYVGYYYNPNPKVRDCVFVLPKVLIDEHGLVFGKYDPVSLIHLDENEREEDEEKRLKPHERKFLYEFAVWIHRAIVVYNETHQNNVIVLRRVIESDGNGAKKKSNSLLDVILNLLRFNKGNRSFFTFVLKNLHSGFNKINWGKTISGTTAVVQGDEPIYLRPVNKKRKVNFDEELIVIFFSILNYVAERFGFRTEIPFGFKLIKGNQFERYINGYGARRLRQIKYKYYSDTAIKLWDLCYAFFDKGYQIRMSASQSEYLLVKSFHIVFEAMIDELVGVPHDQLPPGLADQYDGKLVDHFYTYEGLLLDKPDDDIYYIGDSKYYKIGNSLGTESIYKQYTYARNVIQWNLDIWLNGTADKNNPYERIQLFDDVTEGYNVIPNFFISASIDKETLSYQDRTVPHPEQPPINRQFKNRLYDRDTLLLSHYDVNFLFVLALYARNNSGAKAAWKRSVRDKFRSAVQDMLKEKFDFYAMAAHPNVDASEYFKTHFQETLGKTFRPYGNRPLFSLALDKSYPEDNERLKAKLGQNFYIVPVILGEDPTGSLEIERAEKGQVDSPDGMGKFLFANVKKLVMDKNGDKSISQEYMLFANHEATFYSMKYMPSGDISEVRYFVPMYDGGISGYYEITGISFGSRYNEVKDKSGNLVTVQMPCLNLRFGKYTPLGERIASVPNYRNWNGQIHSYAEVTALYANGYR